MNIRSIANLNPINALKKVERNRTEASADRDANGQQSGGEEPKRHKFSDEELLAALNYLRGLAGVKDNNLTVRLERKEDTVVVYIEDRAGKVIRRIPEQELWLLTREKDKTKGHLLDKAL